MTDSPPVFIADSCIGGLSVVSSLWNAGDAGNAIFLADYAINPLGVKSDPEIADVVERWLRSAENHSDTLVMACNTLSVQHRRLQRSKAAPVGAGTRCLHGRLFRSAGAGRETSPGEQGHSDRWHALHRSRKPVSGHYSVQPYPAREQKPSPPRSSSALSLASNHGTARTIPC